MLTIFQKLTRKPPLERREPQIESFIKTLEKLETQSRQAPEVKSKLNKTKGTT